jgi:hypothetical protein
MLGLLVLVVLRKLQKEIMLEMLVLIAHGQMLRQPLNLPQKVAVLVVLLVLLLVLMLPVMVVLVVVKVLMLLWVVLTLKELNQAIVELMDLDLMGVQEQ